MSEGITDANWEPGMLAPSWVPTEARNWGYKVLTEDRLSPIPPQDRQVGHRGSFGTTVTYPEGQLVTDESFCPCQLDCCGGLHYYPANLRWAALNLETTSKKINKILVVVRCYVPKEGTFVVRGSKARTNLLVTLDVVPTSDYFKRPNKDKIP